MTSGPNNSERQAFIENHPTLVTAGDRALGLYDLENDAAERNDLMESGPKGGKAVLDRFKAFGRARAR
jgi:hypothetical protein